VWAPITLRLVGVTSRNFSTRRAGRQGCSSGHYFGGRPAPWNLGGQKTSKIQRDFWQLSSLIANISGTDPHIENRKSNWSPQSLPRWMKKDGELWSTNKKSYRRAYWPTQVEFRRDFRQLSTLIHQVVLLPAAFEPPKIIVSAVGLAAPGGLTLGCAPYISSFYLYDSLRRNPLKYSWLVLPPEVFSWH